VVRGTESEIQVRRPTVVTDFVCIYAASSKYNT